ncbi:MAG: putative oxidoreductase [Candidatus Omnitrophota bacterium]|jgi:putative oxidoreductase
MNIYNAFRVILGLLFFISGFEKVTQPYQNFQYIIEAYEMVEGNAAMLVARILPWVELIAGLFLMLGLKIRQSLFAIQGMLVLFILVVLQALIRKLDLSSCGCFGESIHIPLWVIYLMDTFFLVGTYVLHKKWDKTRRYSFDAYFAK